MGDPHAWIVWVVPLTMAAIALVAGLWRALRRPPTDVEGE